MNEAAPLVVVVMGVSGSGKSTVGRLLAQRLQLPFVEADDVHPAANRAKMAAGRPLDDADREPWLRALSDWIAAATRSGSGGVMACSALKRAYRDAFRRVGPGVWFLYLTLDPAAAGRRVAARTGHFMPAHLVASQYDVLEPLRADEPGMTVEATRGSQAIAATAAAAVEGRR